MRRILVLALIITTAVTAHAQNCAQTLRLARSTYDQGRLHELKGLLTKCLENNEANGFTKQERVEAYKLLTMGYIYLEEPEKADSSMLLLLNTDYYFKPNEKVDPQEFLGLYKTFRTDPVYRVGLKAGPIATQPNVSESNVANDGNSSYRNKIGFLVGGFVEIPVLKKFILNPELYFVNKKFELNNQVNIVETPSTESQSWISLPVSLQYQFFREKFKKDEARIMPYVSVGAQADYLLSGNINLTTERVGYAPVAPKTVDSKSVRNPINISAVASAGAKMKFGPGLLLAEVRFVYGLSNITNSDGIYANQDLVFSNYLVDGIYKLNSLSLTVGYGYNIFKPKKLKNKVRTSIKKRA